MQSLQDHFLIAMPSMADPNFTQTVTYITPVFGMLWGALFLGEPITRGMIVGFGCIAASMVLVNGIARRAPHPAGGDRSSGSRPAAVRATTART